MIPPVLDPVWLGAIDLGKPYTPPLCPPAAVKKVWPIVGGVNDSRRVECKKKKSHGFYPMDEGCPWCDDAPPVDETPTLAYDPYYGWTTPGKAP